MKKPMKVHSPQTFLELHSKMTFKYIALTTEVVWDLFKNVEKQLKDIACLRTTLLA